MIVSKHYQSATGCIIGLIICLAPASELLAQQDDTTEDGQQPIAEQQSTVTDDYSQQPVITIDEITVTGQRSFFLLRTQIEDAREALYSSYNDLNADDEFDVNCRQSDWTGTNIREQVCWPVFFENIVAEQTQDFIRGNALAEPIGQLETQHKGKFDQLRANIIKVARENPEVEEALVELGTLEAAYEEKRAECMEKTPVLFIFRICR